MRNLLWACLLLSGCGYQWYAHTERPSVLIPYIRGDDDGSLTQEIARVLTTSGKATLASYTGDLRLQVSIASSQNQTVGYRKDKQKVSGEIRDNIVGCEGRRGLTIIAALYKGNSETPIKGPYTLTSYADYDYVDGDDIRDLIFTNSEGVPTKVLPFSLGQLEPVEAAQEATSKPLYTDLAQKIADTLF